MMPVVESPADAVATKSSPTTNQVSPANSNPQKPRRVLVFHDSPGFGGHEIAFLKLLPELLLSEAIASLEFTFYQGNTRLQQALRDLGQPKIHLLPAPYHSTRAASVTAPFRIAYRDYVRSCYRLIHPDIVLMLQGRIEALTVPMIALPATADVVSYIPMAHTAADVGVGKILGYVNDRVRRPYYQRPNRLITPSMAAADQLRRANAKGDIYLVPNTVPPHPLPDKPAVRAMFSVPESKKLALFIGRFEPHQKGLDSLLFAIERDLANLMGWHFLFVGEGSGEPIIRAAVTGPLSGYTSLHPWTSRSRDVVASSDAILMPSRYEGVPLAMLEALSDAVPVLASDIDVFREYLPDFCRWDFQTAPGLSKRLQTMLDEPARTAYRIHSTAVTSDLNRQSPVKLFENALLGVDQSRRVRPRIRAT